MALPVTLTWPPFISKLPDPVSVAAPASVYAVPLNSTRPDDAALKTDVFVPPEVKLTVPLCTSTVPLLLKPSFWRMVVPVATLFRNVPALFNAWAAAPQWREMSWGFVTLNRPDAWLLMTPEL